MHTPDTEKKDATAETNGSPTNGDGHLPKVIIDDSVATEAAAAATGSAPEATGTSPDASSASAETADAGTTSSSPEPTVPMEAVPPADPASNVPDLTVSTVATSGARVGDQAAPSGKGADDDEPIELPLRNRGFKKAGIFAGLAAGMGALVLAAYLLIGATSSTRGGSASPEAPAAPPPVAAPSVGTLPEVRVPAPRLIDAHNCRAGQYRIEGTQLVFTNCATVTLHEPTAP